MTFPAYSAYKDSGVDWLGVVPKHWGVKPLRYLGRFRKGLTITKADLTDRGIPCLNYGEVHSLYPFEVNQDVAPLRSVPAEYLETDPSACVEYGDFVFADTSEDLDGVGNFTHVSGVEPLFAGYHTIIYSINSEVNSRFLAYCLESFAFRTQLRMAVKGVKVFSITQEILRGGIAWLPLLAEQTQIARFLDHETARIDALIEEQQRLIELLKEKRRAVISHAVTKGLDPTVPMKDSGVEWLGELPAHWEVTQVKRRCEVITDGAHISPETENGVYCFVSTRDVSDEGIDFEGCLRTSAASYEYLLKTGCQPAAGDVLFSKDGTIGRTIVVGENSPEFVVASSLIIIRPDKEELLSSYLDFLCQSWVVSQQVEGFVKGAGLPRLSIQNLTKVVGVFPPLEEQVLIVEFLQLRCAAASKLTGEAWRTMELLKERRSALISAAVTGKIDVRGWQPPASAPSPELVQEAV